MCLVLLHFDNGSFEPDISSAQIVFLLPSLLSSRSCQQDSVLRFAAHTYDMLDVAAVAAKRTTVRCPSEGYRALLQRSCLMKVRQSSFCAPKPLYVVSICFFVHGMNRLACGGGGTTLLNAVKYRFELRCRNTEESCSETMEFAPSIEHISSRQNSTFAASAQAGGVSTMKAPSAPGTCFAPVRLTRCYTALGLYFCDRIDLDIRALCV
jgi:hypothetical protein